MNEEFVPRPYAETQRESMERKRKGRPAPFDFLAWATAVLDEIFKLESKRFLVAEWLEYLECQYLDAWAAVEIERRQTGDPNAVPREFAQTKGGKGKVGNIATILASHADVERVVKATESELPAIRPMLLFRHDPRCVEISSYSVTFHDGSTAMYSKKMYDRRPPAKDHHAEPQFKRLVPAWTGFQASVELDAFGLSKDAFLELVYRRWRKTQLRRILGFEYEAVEMVLDGRRAPREE